MRSEAFFICSHGALTIFLPGEAINTRFAIRRRASRYSKINIDIVLYCLDIQDNNRYNIYIQFSIQYQDCGVKNLVLP